MNEVITYAEEKLGHYRKRIEEINNREDLIYKNYEFTKKLPKISPKASENSYYMKDIYHKKQSKAISINLPHSIFRNAITDRSRNNNSGVFNPSLLSFEKHEKTLPTEESLESLPSLYYSSIQNDDNIRVIKDVSGYYKNLKKEIGNKQNAKRMFNKRSLNIMNQCEFRLENKLEKFSDVNCYKFLLSKLAPRDHEEIKKKIEILQIVRKKISSKRLGCQQLK